MKFSGLAILKQSQRCSFKFPQPPTHVQNLEFAGAFDNTCSIGTYGGDDKFLVISLGWARPLHDGQNQVTSQDLELEVTLVLNLNDQGVLSDGISKAIYLLLIHVEV